MWDFLTRLFDISDFPPRWQCGSWTSGHGWLHIVSDLSVWGAYVAIPLVLGYFVIRRRDIPFRGIFLLFGAFILACGTTHLMESIIFWWPAYRLAGAIKLFTALVSWGTVIALIPTTPKVLAFRSPGELEREVDRRVTELAAANDALRAEVARREAVETALRMSEARFRSLADSMPQIVWQADPDGRLDYYNERWYEFTGFPRGKSGDSSWEPILHPEDVRKCYETWYSAVRSGQPYQIEYRFKDRTAGGYRWFLGRALPIRDDQGRIDRWFGTCTDIDETKRAQESLRDADRRKDEFLAMLAHELRNPLAPVRNAVHIMSLIDPGDPNLRWARDVIGRQVGHMARLVDDLLDVSRITRGMISLHFEVVDLLAAIERAVETSRPLLDARGHDVTVEVPSGPVWVRGDLTRLAQVFANLLDNAAKYTPDAGRVTVTIKRGTPVANAPDAPGVVTVRVVDTGVGIAPDLLPRVFDLFTQAERSLDRAQGGLGIGLSLVKTMVDLHGGRVEAHSPGPGQGSEFVVHLPLASESAIREAAAKRDQQSRVAEVSPTSSKRVSVRVLVVDDNTDAAMSLAMLLRAAGHVTEAAHDGSGALAVAERFRPDVVLLDIGLPGMDGYEVARRLRAADDGRRLLLVAVTGYGGEDAKQRTAEAGFDRHLVKPIDLEDVHALLRAAGV